MKFQKLNSTGTINVSLDKYLIDWDHVVSKPQKKVKDFVFTFWKTDVVLEEFMIPGSRLRIDLLNISKKIAIEVSPNSTHKNFNPFMHGSRASGYLKTFKSDIQKKEWIKSSGFGYVKLTDLELKTLDRDSIEKQFNITL